MGSSLCQEYSNSLRNFRLQDEQSDTTNGNFQEGKRFLSDVCGFNERDFAKLDKKHGPYPYCEGVEWICFPLLISEGRDFYKDWCTSYHGTHPSKLRSIVHQGLKKPGQKDIDGNVIKSTFGVQEEFVSSSPNIMYSASETFAKWVEFPDSSRDIDIFQFIGNLIKKSRTAQVVLELRQQPGSFFTISQDWKSQDSHCIKVFSILIRTNTMSTKRYPSPSTHVEVSANIDPKINSFRQHESIIKGTIWKVKELLRVSNQKEDLEKELAVLNNTLNTVQRESNQLLAISQGISLQQLNGSQDQQLATALELSRQIFQEVEDHKLALALSVSMN